LRRCLGPGAATGFAGAPSSVVLADAAAATYFAIAPHLLVLADTTAAAVFTPVSPSMEHAHVLSALLSCTSLQQREREGERKREREREREREKS